MKIFFRFIILAVILVPIIGFFGYSYALNYYWHAPGAASEPKELLIKRGMSSSAIIRLLEQTNAITHPELFKLFAYRVKDLQYYKAGEYKISPFMAPSEISALLRKGANLQRRITIPEGLVTGEIIQRIREHPHLRGDISTVPAEGQLLPDTYLFTRGMTRDALINVMKKAQQQTLDVAWQLRQKDLPLRSQREALILASIIEKETGANDERGMVAGVFINRLRKNMKLQSDPTANYGLYLRSGKLKQRLMLKDVADQSAYNTYVIDRLPPSPICNPGKAAILATLNPRQTNALYFVANGKGGHIFADSLAQHNRNVAAYHALMRKQRRAAKQQR